MCQITATTFLHFVLFLCVAVWQCRRFSHDCSRLWLWPSPILCASLAILWIFERFLPSMPCCLHYHPTPVKAYGTMNRFRRWFLAGKSTSHVWGEIYWDLFQTWLTFDADGTTKWHGFRFDSFVPTWKRKTDQSVSVMFCCAFMFEFVRCFFWSCDAYLFVHIVYIYIYTYMIMYW